VTGTAALERGYRRLLACYPRRFRDEHREEMLAVLLACARDGQRRPGLIEAADLIRSGLGMRLRPDSSQAARQGWSDALAVFSLAGPVFLVLTSLAADLTLYRRAVLTLAHPRGFWILLGLQVLVAALVVAAQRWAAVAVMAVTAAYSAFPWFSLRWLWPLSPPVLSVYLLITAALFSSPGPRYGRHLVHWGHGVVLLVAAAAVQTYWVMPWPDLSSPLALLLPGIIFAVVIAGLTRVLRLGRYFGLLLAAMFYPTALTVVANIWWPGFLNLQWPQWLALFYAGPLLTAAAAMISAIRPRRRQII
jgi:hypothetical protein